MNTIKIPADNNAYELAQYHTWLKAIHKKEQIGKALGIICVIASILISIFWSSIGLSGISILFLFFWLPAAIVTPPLVITIIVLAIIYASTKT